MSKNVAEASCLGRLEILEEKIRCAAEAYSSLAAENRLLRQQLEALRRELAESRSRLERLLAEREEVKARLRRLLEMVPEAKL